ncbi:hypothetical protein HNY73_004091 [Argiope bruennichi]|uniref:Uncharacterized protein n=1 Tax=Argiope bruennichi TaxID=94029 RepID=A0A8T0FMT7_ARGBR|nr:hypothetical protein HNY73_004091 [Argiope bruennichi]
MRRRVITRWAKEQEDRVWPTIRNNGRVEGEVAWLVDFERCEGRKGGGRGEGDTGVKEGWGGRGWGRRKTTSQHVVCYYKIERMTLKDSSLRISMLPYAPTYSPDTWKSAHDFMLPRTIHDLDRSTERWL